MSRHFLIARCCRFGDHCVINVRQLVCAPFPVHVVGCAFDADGLVDPSSTNLVLASYETRALPVYNMVSSARMVCDCWIFADLSYYNPFHGHLFWCPVVWLSLPCKLQDRIDTGHCRLLAGLMAVGTPCFSLLCSQPLEVPWYMEWPLMNFLANNLYFCLFLVIFKSTLGIHSWSKRWLHSKFHSFVLGIRYNGFTSVEQSMDDT